MARGSMSAGMRGMGGAGNLGVAHKGCPNTGGFPPSTPRGACAGCYPPQRPGPLHSSTWSSVHPGAEVLLKPK